MYPNLYYLFKDLFGVEIPFLQAMQSFGVMLAASILIAAWLLKIELLRKAKAGLLLAEEIKLTIGKPATTQEIAMSAAGGFFVGWKLLGIAFNFNQFVDDPQSFVFSMQGSLIAGVALGTVMGYFTFSDKKKKSLPEPKEIVTQLFPHQRVADIAIMAALFGLLGAKIFDNLEHPSEFIQDPFGSLFSFSGLTFYGALIFGAGYLIWFCRKHKVPVAVMADAVAPALILAYGVGRIGCQLSGDGDWGIINTAPKPSWFVFPQWAWSFTYPHNVINDGVHMIDCVGRYCNELPQPVFPTPLYESFFSILIFSLLWMIRKRFSSHGMLFSIYLFLNGVERLLIEQIRVNVRYHFFGMSVTQAEIIAVIMILLGVSGIIWLNKKPTAFEKL